MVAAVVAAVVVAVAQIVVEATEDEVEVEVELVIALMVAELSCSDCLGKMKKRKKEGGKWMKRMKDRLGRAPKPSFWTRCRS